MTGPDDIRERPGVLLSVLSLARELGFLGPGPVEPHIEHALGFSTAVMNASGGEVEEWRCVDLGSGGGLPGLVLAGLWPRSRWLLVDGSERRTRFLRESIVLLGGEDRIEVHTERAEVTGRDPACRGRFDLATARGFGPPAATAECAAPLLGVGGWLVVSEPPGGAADRWPAEALADLGFGPPTITTDVPAFMAVRLASPTPDRYPRRVGVPTKRPLF